MNDTDVRDLLTRVAGEVPATPVDPEPLLRRGYRRMARTAVAGALGITCAIFLAVAGVGLIRSSAPTTIPGDQGQPTEPPETVTGETTGTWTGPCLDSQDGPPPWVCLGPLEEGTYTSQRFEPALTFTVPAGWNNPWDTRGAFTLWTPGWSDASYVLSHAGLHVRRDPRPNEEGCFDATVGTSAIEVATWVANHPAIATKGPSPVEVGGLTGYQLDVSLADTWRESCPGTPAIWLFDDLYLRDPNKSPEFATMRLILLDLPDGGSVLIAIDEDRLDVAMPVVDSFSFDLD
ncbi:MAG TPA: hypothetical protein VJN50_04930 [Actinomycetota bacterium]|nr:hypothetical protein [Actinomycetota bacterium]